MELLEVTQPLKENNQQAKREMISTWRKLTIVGLFFFDSLIHGALVFGWVLGSHLVVVSCLTSNSPLIENT